MSRRFCCAFACVLILASTGPVRAAPSTGAAATRTAPVEPEARAKLVQAANARLLAASRKNQCAFRKDSDVLLPGCERKLKALADAVLAVKKQLNRAGVPAVVFQVLGYTGSAGTPEFNHEISERRASTIARELVGLGVPSSEILAFGLASAKPLVTPDDTPAKQAKNQRYELQVKL
jgi:outer membrane protein OmpA-like peptidoglycan-associated protein